MEIKYSKLNWPQILESLNTTFSERPDIELALAEVFEQGVLKRLHGKFSTILRIIKWIITVTLWYRLKKKKKIKITKNAGLFSINLSRANDFGIIFPIIKKADKKGLPTIVLVNKYCYKIKNQELKSLKNAIIVNKSRLKNSVCSFKKAATLFNNAINAFNLISNKVNNNIVDSFVKRHKLQFIKFFINQRTSAESLEQLFSKTKIDYIVSLGERNLGLFGKRNNIKTYAIQHGHFTKESISYWCAFTPANSSEIIVFGKQYLNVVKEVYPQSNVVALGNPYYDSIRRQPLNVPNRKIVLTFFSFFHSFIGKKSIFSDVYLVNVYLEFLVKLYQDYKNKIVLRVKLHPNESKDYIVHYNNLFGREIKIIENKDSFEVLKSTDIAVAWVSTVSIESVLLGKLFVQLLLNSKWKLFEMDWGVKIHSYFQFEKLLNKIHSDSNYYLSETKRQYSYIPELLSNLGCSAHAICEHLIACQEKLE